MTDPELTTPPKKKHLWRYFPVLLIFGLAIYLLTPQVNTMIHSWEVVRNLTWWAVGLAAACEVISWLGNGIVFSAILKIHNQKLPVWKGALIAIATLSVSIVAGGGVGLAMTYSWIHHESKDGNTAVLAGVLPSFLNNGVMVAVSMIGTFYLMVVRVLTKAQLYEFGVILLVLGLFTGFVIFALRSPGLISRIAVWLTSRWAAIRKKSDDPQKTITTVEDFIAAWHSLGKGKWLRPLVGAAVNIGFDMLALYFLFVAAGEYLSIGKLFAGYGLPILLGKMAFLFPGGVGVVEGTMVALFRGLQVKNSIGAVVVIGYRLFSLWLPLIAGFFATAYLSGKTIRGRRKKSEQLDVNLDKTPDGE
ncbi:MAG: YbhN family protein [Anaerolineaceae bacterium]